MIKIKDVSNLKNQILLKGYSLASFSKELGLSPSYLAKIFKTQKISPKNAHKIVVLLNKRFDEFFLIL